MVKVFCPQNILLVEVREGIWCLPLYGKGNWGRERLICTLFPRYTEPCVCRPVICRLCSASGKFIWNLHESTQWALTDLFSFLPSSHKAGIEPERESRLRDSWNSALFLYPKPMFPISCCFHILVLFLYLSQQHVQTLEAPWETLGGFLKLTFSLDQHTTHKAALSLFSSPRTRPGGFEICWESYLHQGRRENLEPSLVWTSGDTPSPQFCSTQNMLIKHCCLQRSGKCSVCLHRVKCLAGSTRQILIKTLRDEEQGGKLCMRGTDLYLDIQRADRLIHSFYQIFIDHSLLCARHCEKYSGEGRHAKILIKSNNYDSRGP